MSKIQLEAEFNCDQVIKSLRKISQSTSVQSELLSLNNEIKTAQTRFSAACSMIIRGYIYYRIQKAIKALNDCTPPKI
jgi:hypothetical protein